MDVKLEGRVRFESDGCFETRNFKFRTEESSKDFSNGGFGNFSGTSGGSALFVADFEPTAFVDVVGGIGAIRWGGTIQFTFVHDFDGFLV